MIAFLAMHQKARINADLVHKTSKKKKTISSKGKQLGKMK